MVAALSPALVLGMAAPEYTPVVKVRLDLPRPGKGGNAGNMVDAIKEGVTSMGAGLRPP